MLNNNANNENFSDEFYLKDFLDLLLMSGLITNRDQFEIIFAEKFNLVV